MKLTPTQRQNFEKLDKVHSRVFDILDTARYEMVERGQPIYGNPAYKEAQRMMGYEWDYLRQNCVDLYRQNLTKSMRTMKTCGLLNTYRSLEVQLFWLDSE